MDCPSLPGSGAMDRCQTITTDGVVALTCSRKALNELLKRKDNDCTTKTMPPNSISPKYYHIEWCICDTEGCNSASQSANQVTLVFAVLSLMMPLLNWTPVQAMGIQIFFLIRCVTTSINNSDLLTFRWKFSNGSQGNTFFNFAFHVNGILIWSHWDICNTLQQI